jgi:26S proteasome non-ATPase regulatory subunit 9
VSENSPAEVAGLRVGDAVTEFGTLNSDNFESLKSVAAVTESNAGQNIRVRF